MRHDTTAGSRQARPAGRCALAHPSACDTGRKEQIRSPHILHSPFSVTPLKSTSKVRVRFQGSNRYSTSTISPHFTSPCLVSSRSSSSHLVSHIAPSTSSVNLFTFCICMPCFVLGSPSSFHHLTTVLRLSPTAQPSDHVSQPACVHCPWCMGPDKSVTYVFTSPWTHMVPGSQEIEGLASGPRHGH